MPSGVLDVCMYGAPAVGGTVTVGMGVVVLELVDEVFDSVVDEESVVVSVSEAVVVAASVVAASVASVVSWALDIWGIARITSRTRSANGTRRRAPAGPVRGRSRIL